MADRTHSFYSCRHVALLAVLSLALKPYTALGCYKRLVDHGAIPLLYIDDCTSNYDVGLLVGSTFSSTIKGRMRDSLAFHKVQDYCATNWGRQLLAALKDRHHFAFPAYYSELMGLAAGAGVPFDQIFMLNLRQEILAAGESPETMEAFLQWASQPRWQRRSETVDDSEGEGGGGDDGENGRSDGSSLRARDSQQQQHHVLRSGSGRGGDGGGGDVDGGGAPHIDPLSVDACSDVAVRLAGAGGGDAEPPRVFVLGHNEDMTNDTLGRMYYIRVTMPGRGSWFALTYAGELASTAFGANTAGVAFTLNALYPRDAQLPGLGRNFLSRRLLDTASVDEALQVLALKDQATGRSVNLMSTRPPLALWNVEVGPGGAHDVLQLGENDWYYHANAYMRLPQRQKADNSSAHREARFAQYPMPGGASDVLAMLGDTDDPDYPIFRTGDYGGLVYTLCTVLYDLTARRMIVYRGNPRNGLLGSVLSLDTLMPVGPYDTPDDHKHGVEDEQGEGSYNTEEHEDGAAVGGHAAGARVAGAEDSRSAERGDGRGSATGRGEGRDGKDGEEQTRDSRALGTGRQGEVADRERL